MIKRFIPMDSPWAGMVSSLLFTAFVFISPTPVICAQADALNISDAQAALAKLSFPLRPAPAFQQTASAAAAPAPVHFDDDMPC